MGWASGGLIFDTVADQLIKAGLDDTTLFGVCETLIDALRDGDWDTEHESFEQYAAYLPIRAAFYNAGTGGDLDDDTGGVEGTIRYVDGDWCLGCQRCGLLESRPFTVEGHNDLVAFWLAHNRHSHGACTLAGDVEHFLAPVPENPPAVSTALTTGVAKALETAMSSGQTDGEHHKAWVIDQMVRALTDCPTVTDTAYDHLGQPYRYQRYGQSDAYQAFITRHNDGEDGPDTYHWDEGIAP